MSTVLKPISVKQTPTGYEATLSWDEIERFLATDPPQRFHTEGIPVSGTTDLLRETLADHIASIQNPENRPL